MIRDFARQSAAALRLLLVLTVVLGIGYPLAVWAIGQTLGDRAAGQPVRSEGRIVGSRLIGQEFDGDQWFRSRPSAGGYDTLASGPSNLGPSNSELLALIESRRQEIAVREDVPPSDVPADALTASASGLDPQISPEYADLQAARVARVNGLSLEEVESLIVANTQGRFLGIHGEPGVNVLDLNLAVLRASRT